MGKKKGGSGSGENEKVVAARDRKAAQKDEKNSRQAKQAEDAFWEGAGEGAKSKAQKKKEEADARAAEAAKKKREAKLLAEAEEQALARAGKKDKSEPKMTAFERSKIKESDKERAAREAKEREMAAKRQVSEEDYAKQMRLEEENRNRNEDEIAATGLTQALNALTTDPGSNDIHPEKRVKAAFNAFYEAKLPELKSEKPGLRANQYRDMLWKQFQKSPENPMNRVQAS